MDTFAAQLLGTHLIFSPKSLFIVILLAHIIESENYANARLIPISNMNFVEVLLVI